MTPHRRIAAACSTHHRLTALLSTCCMPLTSHRGIAAPWESSSRQNMLQAHSGFICQLRLLCCIVSAGQDAAHMTDSQHCCRPVANAASRIVSAGLTVVLLCLLQELSAAPLSTATVLHAVVLCVTCTKFYVQMQHQHTTLKNCCCC